MPAKNSRLPEGWIWSTFGNAFNVFVGATPSRKLPEYWGGNIAWVSSGEVAFCEIHTTRETITQLGLENTSTEVHPPGTILLGMIGEGKTRGQAAILEIAAAHNQNSAAIRVSEAGLPPKFVYYFLKHEYERTRQIGSGNNQPALNKARVQSITFPLPPLNEQRRIVAKIEALKARSQRVKEELEAIPVLLDQFRQSVLAAAFRGDLTADWREKNPDVEPASVLLERIRAERRRRWEEAELEKMKAQGKTPKDDKWKSKYKEPLPPNPDYTFSLPPNWAWASLDSLCSHFVDCAHRTPKYSEEGYPALRPRDVVNGRLNIDNAARVSRDEYLKQTERRQPQFGDIIYSRELSFGWAVAVPPDVQLCMSQGMVLFRPGNGILGSFIINYLNGSFGRQQSEAAAVGSAHPHINLTEIRAYAMAVPPVEEQKQIVLEIDQKLATIASLEKALADATEYLGLLDRSILAKAFRGELVSQDPNDEPASVLLERIRAEREKLDTKKKAKGKSEKKSRKAKPEAAEPEQLSLPGFE